MAYFHSGQEPYGWARSDPLTGCYNLQSWEGDTHTLPDAAPLAAQKTYDFQPPHDLLYTFESASMQSIYPYGGPLDQGQILRYSSPGATQASSLSEASYSDESAYSLDNRKQSIRYSTSPQIDYAQQTLKLNGSPHAQHMPWQIQTQHTILRWDAQTVAPDALPTQPAMALLEDVEFEHEDSKALSSVSDEEVLSHPRSPLERPQPEELEISEPTTGSVPSPRDVSQAKKSVREHRREDDMDMDEDENENGNENNARIPVDDHSDSSYQARPRKRKNIRNPMKKNSKSYKQRCKSSTASTQGNFRVHKRTTSTITTAAGTGHSRQPPRPKQPKKGPIFARALSSTSTRPIDKADRTFPCTFHHFGCTAEFPNKNEWKRHVACQHLQLGYYRCDLDGCNPDHPSGSSKSTRHYPSRTLTKKITTKLEFADDVDLNNADATQEGEEILLIYNDFNRKDLFTQHARRMHGPSRNPALCTTTNKRGVCVASKDDEVAFERQLDAIRARCWNIRRRAPARSTCGFCRQVFDAEYSTHHAGESHGPEEKAWEERMEHVGWHYEKDAGARPDSEEIDDDLVHWGLATGVLCRLDDGRPWLVSVEAPCGEGEESGVKMDNEKARRVRRQPSRTVVVRKRSHDNTPPVVKNEEHEKEEEHSDVDADGEDE